MSKTRIAIIGYPYHFAPFALQARAADSIWISSPVRDKSGTPTDPPNSVELLDAAYRSAALGGQAVAVTTLYNDGPL